MIISSSIFHRTDLALYSIKLYILFNATDIDSKYKLLNLFELTAPNIHKASDFLYIQQQVLIEVVSGLKI